MGFLEGIGKDTIAELDQHVRAWLDLLEEKIKALRDDTEVEITIKFRKKASP